MLRNILMPYTTFFRELMCMRDARYDFPSGITESMRQFLQRYGGIAFGMAFNIGIVYIAYEIHWALHRLLGDALWIIISRLSLAFGVGIGIGLYIARMQKKPRHRPRGTSRWQRRLGRLGRRGLNHPRIQILETA